MRLMFIVPVAAMVLAVAPAAHAEMSANELLFHYDSGDREIRDFLEAVIDGNSNGISWMNSYLDEYRGPSHQIYCPPDDFITDGAGMIDMMRTSIQHDPQYGELPYGAAVMFAYIDHFPCR